MRLTLRADKFEMESSNLFSEKIYKTINLLMTKCIQGQARRQQFCS
jgi:hypothetical protein